MVEIATVSNPDQAHQLVQVLAEVWGESNILSKDVVIGVVHAGGYASLAFEVVDNQQHYVGASLAFIAKDNKLHSHVTGVVRRAVGVGRELKQHQWRWASDHGFAAISWTFDPLVRRNAHFNLVSLGATVGGYHQNFYGELDDVINTGELTDRLLVNRQVEGLSQPPSGQTCIANSDDLLIATPADIEVLRKQDRLQASKWRLTQRTSFEMALADSYFVRGFSNDGSYVLSRKGS